MLSWLDRWAHEAPERLAIAEAGEEIRFAGLQAAVDATARELRPGAIVATLLPSGVGFTIAQLAALKAGATFFPLPSDATAAELERAFALARPDLVLVPPEAKAADLDALLPADLPRARVGEPLPHHAAAAPLDAAMVQLTSGSTGHPKGVLLDHAALESGLEAAAPHVARIAGAAVFSPMPQYHAMGGALVLEHLAQGVSVLVARRFVPGEDRRRMREAGVRAIAGPPSYFRLLLRLGMFRGDALPDVRSFLLGSASAEPALLAGLRDAVPEASLHLRYGLSETFGTLTRLDVEAGEALPTPGLVGVPLGAELGPLPAPGEAPGEVRARGACVARAALRPGG
ncbi:MAG: AMP-binding protein, partial [Myxococcota bacterium]